jgi:hypothetical protein
MQHRPVGRLAWVQTKLFEEAADADPGALVPDPDPDRSILVMDAHYDHRPLEARVANAGHRQQQFSGQEAWRIHKGKMRFA